MVGAPPTAKCCLCGTHDNIAYCSLCDKWFCPRCRTLYGQRAKAAAGEWWTRIFGGK